MDALVEEGFIILGGPVGNGEQTLHVVEAADENTVRTRFAQDPWASAGLLQVGVIEHWALWLDSRMPLVEAELNRRYPDRARMRPADPAGFRDAWATLERLWQQTVDRARQLPANLLYQQVDGEWSFIETLRHLVFATDAWVRRVILGEPSPWHPLDLPHDEMADEPSVPRDREARPPLEQVLALRADRMATVRQIIAGLTDEKLAAMTEPVTEPGYPEPRSYSVRECLQIVLNEEWEHRLYAERDIDTLESAPRAT